MFGMLSVFVDFERSIIQERVRAGLRLVEIHREFITASARWMFAAKL
jgi:hypothetical protein